MSGFDQQLVTLQLVTMIGYICRACLDITHSDLCTNMALLSLELRKRILDLYRRGKSARSICQIIQASDGRTICESTVFRLLRYYKQFGHCELPVIKRSSYRVTKQCIAIVEREMETHEDTEGVTSPKLQRRIEKETGIRLGLSTVFNYIYNIIYPIILNQCVPAFKTFIRLLH